MTSQAELDAVLAAYGPELRPQRIALLSSAGGFSGAQLWKVYTDAGLLCLRRWPSEHPDRSRLEYTHAVLRHVGASGFRHIPIPLATRAGATSVWQGGHFWELTAWLPGRPDFTAPASRSRLESAMRALADFHAAAASFPSQESSVACSPSLTERARRLRHYVRGGLPEIASALAAGGWPELQGRGRRLLALFSAAAPGFVELVDRAAQTPTRLQPCIRDIRPEHVLFTGDVVTGIVDFGAMRSESVAADVARLLGGMAGDDLPAWRVGLESYEAIRPLDNTERFLLGVFNQTAVLLSGMNWLQWICVEQRRFDNPRQILARLDAILDRMARLSQPAPFR